MDNVQGQIENLAEESQDSMFLSFMLDQEVYCIEIKYVTEIVSMQKITEVPELPEYVKGIINLRGRIIPIIDIRMRFKKVPKEYHARTCIIVLDVDDMFIGIVVDNVSEVIAIAEDDIIRSPNSDTGFSNKYVWGIKRNEEGLMLLVDCKKLLGDAVKP